MNKKAKVLFVVLCLLCIVGCSNKQEKKQENNVNTIDSSKRAIVNVKYKIEKKNNCNDEKSLYYSYDNRNIYLVCLDEVYVNEDVTLKKYISVYKNRVTQIIKTIESTLTIDKDSVKDLNDGGSKIYSNGYMTMVECNTLEGNKNIFIGDANTNYDNICK